MTKTALEKLAKSVTLPKNWIIQNIYPKNKNNSTDKILFGCPIEEKMSNTFETYRRKVNKVLKQLNESNSSSKKWGDDGGGYGVGSKYYDVCVVLDF